MKPYIIAAFLFVTGFLVLGVLTADLMAPAKPRPQAHAVPQQQTGGLAPTGPAEPSYPAATPWKHPAGTEPAAPGMSSTMPGMAATMPGMPGTGTPPGSGLTPGVAGPLGISTTVPLPKLQPIEPTNPVPIIQPTDLGSPPTPIAGRQHQ